MIMNNFRFAAKAFIVDDNKLFIIKRSPDDIQKPNIWEIPGGRLEPGEDPVKGLKREIKEETNLDIEVLHPLSVRHFTRDDKQKITMIVFLCELTKKTKIKLSKEHTKYDWIEIKKAKTKLTDFFHKEIDVFTKLFQ